MGLQKATANEALAGLLRPGNAGANTAADQITVAEAAIAQIPAEHIASIEILLRVDSAGAAMSFSSVSVIANVHAETGLARPAPYFSAASCRNCRFIALTWARYAATS